MFDLEKEIKEWKKGFNKYGSFEDGLVADMELHLRDAFASLRQEGLSTEDSFRQAVEQVGTAESIAVEFHKNRELALDRRTPWRPARFMPALAWNYLKIALRKIKRQKGFSFINIAGLAVGLASCIMILLWVRDEMSYDRFHVNAEAIQRVLVHSTAPGGDVETYASLPPNLGPALKAELPEVRLMARYISIGQQVVANGEKKFYEKNISLCDPEFFQMFSFPLRRGDAQNALANPHSIMLSEATAVKYFGIEDPIGKNLRLNNLGDYTITGILAGIPEQSSLSFDILLPFLAAEDFGFPIQTWDRFSYNTYILLETGADVRQLSGKIATRLQKAVGDPSMTLSLQPLPEIHLRSTHILEGGERGNIKTVFLFSVLALFVLLMACINYLNLTTAQGGSRGKEIALRKVTGARRGEIAGQFLGESLLQTGLAMIIALAAIPLCLPLFNTLSRKNISFGQLISPSAGGFLLGFLLLTGLLAGLYPAWYLSSLKPASVLKGSFERSAGGSGMRKLLVVLQFSLTIIMIIGSLTVFRQMRFLRTRPLGFDPDCILMLPVRGSLASQVAPLKAEILRDASVANASAASDPAMMFRTSMTIENWEGQKPGARLECDYVWCDEDYIKTLGIETTQGQFFSAAMSGSLAEKIVINETAVRALGFDSPIGKRLDDREIIGVVRDFPAHSLHSAIGPVAMVYDPAKFRYLFVKIKPGRDATALASLAGIWTRVAPEYPFEFTFLDQQIGDLYHGDRQQGGVINVFTLLALLIANLGLLGMASYLIARRRKEIGVRKALGASVPQIMAMLSREFTKWVAMASLLACPLAYHIMNRWLRAFAYRVSLGTGEFILSIALTFLIALLTISSQSLRAARANPVESLRYE
jgi:putative ABC transport system permease protein